MRLVIDLQGCQTTGSKNRGIGNYSRSITEAIIRNSRHHEIFIVLNGRFHQEALDLKAEFSKVLPSSQIFIFEYLGLCAQIVASPERVRASEALAGHVLRTLNPDAILVASLFEGLIDDATTSLDFGDAKILSATLLYDLIPLIRKEQYLTNEKTRDWYFGRLRHLKKADVVCAISESTRQEALRELNLAPERVVNISSAIGPQFVRYSASDLESSDVLERLGIEPQFLLYTGGIDYRKNIEGLIEAYALIDAAQRARHQLVVVCSVTDVDAERLRRLAAGFGVTMDRFVLTGFVTETDLIQLYNLCHLFVFPSLHEGFGLPVLEAMSCGAPVIAGANSSLVELVDWDAALFDASNPASIADLIGRCLEDSSFRVKLRNNGEAQAKKYSWDRSANALLDALELSKQRKDDDVRALEPKLGKLKLAIVSPAPPLKTGVAEYVAELIPFLSNYYQIDVVSDQQTFDRRRLDVTQRSIDWFLNNHDHYDRILYQVGNSAFHAHIPRLLHQISGVVVLHDFFISGMLHSMCNKNPMEGNSFLEQLVDTHGLRAVAQSADLNREVLIRQFSLNGQVLEDAGGLIVHSKQARNAIIGQGWAVAETDVTQIKLLRLLGHPSKRSAQATLGIEDRTIVICSFGFVDHVKRSVDLLEAFAEARLNISCDTKLIFVGSGGEVGRHLLDRAAALGLSDQFQITGFVEPEIYRLYLQAADLAIQLRRHSRGETSAAVLDCMASGVPLIINAHGTMAEIDDTLVYKLPDEFRQDQLADAIVALATAPNLRRELADRAREYIAADHDPKAIAAQYHQAIETFYAKNIRSQQPQLLRSLTEICKPSNTGQSLMAESLEHVNWNMRRRRERRLYIDASCLTEGRRRRAANLGHVKRTMRLLVDADDLSYNLELVSFRMKPAPGFYTNRRLAFDVLERPRLRSPMQLISPGDGDAMLCLDGTTKGVADSKTSGRFSVWRAKGVDIFFLPHPIAAWLSTFLSGEADDKGASEASASAILESLEPYVEITPPSRSFITATPGTSVPDRPFMNLSPDMLANRPIGEFICTVSNVVMPLCRRTAVTKRLAEQFFSFGAEVQMRARARRDSDG